MDDRAQQTLVPDAVRFRLLPDSFSSSSNVNNRGYISPRSAARFEGDGLHERFARALGERRAVRFKEVLEAIEFFAAVRKRVRSTATILDVCAGHGLVGLLFGMFERRVQRVVLIEPAPPDNRDRILAAALEVAPWLEEKLVLCEERLGQAAPRLAREHQGAAVLAVHACGTLTDEAIGLGLEVGGPIALLPCCRPHSRSPAPGGLARALGADVAFDVDRTYRMEREGWNVRWTDIPAAITPMNRVLLAWPRQD